MMLAALAARLAVTFWLSSSFQTASALRFGHTHKEAEFNYWTD